ncbi:MAG TPA: hypothetical protein DEO49_04650 [Sutterella sp.]|nr:hypothetical protein [Sutterella sp.]
MTCTWDDSGGVVPPHPVAGLLPLPVFLRAGLHGHSRIRLFRPDISAFFTAMMGRLGGMRSYSLRLLAQSAWQARSAACRPGWIRAALQWKAFEVFGETECQDERQNQL